MIEAPLPDSEKERHQALLDLRILDTPPEERFDRITRTAQALFGVKMCYIALVDSTRQWFKAKCGLTDTQTPRNTSFCGHAILENQTLVVPDASLDSRFHDNPMVIGQPFVRFYAGRPLHSLTGYNVGTLCVADCEPRSVTDGELARLDDLAAMVEDQLNLMEISRLQKELREAHTDLKTKSEFIQSVFGQYAGGHLLQKVLTHPQSVQIGGETKEVTILMSDLRGFTELSSQKSAASLVKILNVYFESMIEIVDQFGGLIVDFVGDGMLVVFGAVSSDENHADRAMQCARCMQLEMDALYEKSENIKDCGLKMGIGIHTGEAVVGNVGSSKRLKFGVVGEAVNLASRIESFTVGGQILVSTATLKCAQESFGTDGKLRVKLKGISSPFTIHELSLK